MAKNWALVAERKKERKTLDTFDQFCRNIFHGEMLAYQISYSPRSNLSRSPNAAECRSWNPRWDLQTGCRKAARSATQRYLSDFRCKSLLCHSSTVTLQLGSWMAEISDLNSHGCIQKTIWIIFTGHSTPEPVSALRQPQPRFSYDKIQEASESLETAAAETWMLQYLQFCQSWTTFPH